MLETAQQLSSAPRATGSALAHTWRLVRWEIFLARRRALAKVLAAIYVGFYLLVIGFLLLAYATTSSSSPNSAGQFSDLLTFPKSLTLVLGYISFTGVFLFSALAGALVGGEYGYSTQRLAFSRGVGRGQMLAAQVAALAILALVVAGAVYVLSSLIGVTLGPALGGSVTWPQADGWREIALVWLANSAELFAYMLLAAFFATLGRSVVAGVLFPLGLYVGQFIVTNVIVPLIETVTLGPAYLAGSRNWVGHVPDWLLSNNTSELIGKAGNGPIALTTSNSGGIQLGNVLGVGHAALVVAGYCVVLVVASYLLLRSRDITD